MILIAYDGSDDSRAAITRSGALYGGQQAVILTVWQPFLELMARTGSGIGLTPGMVDFEAVDRASAEQAGETAAEGVQVARDAGLEASPRTALQRTTTAQAIIAEADAVDADAIVMGTRGLSGFKSMLLGSVSHSVLQHADRPVTVVPSAKVAGQRHEHLS